MELSGLLGTSFACDCGRVHSVPVRRFLYDPGAVDSLPEIIQQNCGDSHNLVVVADVRTWDICGRQAEEVLKKSGADVARVVVPDRRNGGPVCDDVTVRPLVDRLRGMRPDLVWPSGAA